MNSKKDRSDQTDGAAAGQPTDFEVERRHQAVENNVDKVVAQRLHFAPPVIEAERQHCQRPVAFVALLFAHWGAPEVIQQQVAKGNVRS